MVPCPLGGGTPLAHLPTGGAFFPFPERDGSHPGLGSTASRYPTPTALSATEPRVAKTSTSLKKGQKIEFSFYVKSSLLLTLGNRLKSFQIGIQAGSNCLLSVYPWHKAPSLTSGL